ncbi:hypothetical protein QTP86_031045, partial [Hemibagrus guttatus]
MHVFGLGEETGVPGGNPRGTGRTCKLHTHMAEARIKPPTLEVWGRAAESLVSITGDSGQKAGVTLDEASLGIKAGYTLDGVPAHHRVYTLSHSHTTDNLEMPINLQCMSLDRGRKPEYPEETPEAWGEHANSTHTRRRRESNPQPWRWEANVLTPKTTKP